MEMNSEVEIISPLKAIKQYCLNCGDGTKEEVKSCLIKNCELYPFRFGKNPYRKKREMTEEQRLKAAERLKKARSKKEEE